MCALFLKRATTRAWLLRITGVAALLVLQMALSAGGVRVYAQENGPTSGGAGAQLPDTFLQEYDQIVAGRNAAADDSRESAADSGSGLASTLTVTLLVIAGLIYGGVWLLRQAKGAKGGLAAGAGLLSVQESRQIGPNQKLHLVQLGEDILLLGATEQSISFLARYRADDLPESFAEHLQTAGGPDPAGTGAALFATVLTPGPGILQDSLEQLRRLRPGSGGGGDD